VPRCRTPASWEEAVTTTRTATECALLGGAPECRCPREAGDLTEEQVVDRALSKVRFGQRADPAGRAAARRGLDAMLDQARGHGPSTLVSELLRMGITARLLGEDAADADEVEALLQEFVELAELDADPRRLGEAATLRAHRTAVYGHEEDALADAATAFAILTDITAPPPGEDPGRWARSLARSLNGLVVVLLKLGSHELADEVSQRAVAVAQGSGSVMDRLVHQLNRTRLQLSWALRLERSGRDTAAATRFAAAAQTARTAAPPCTRWRTSPGTGSCWPSRPPGACSPRAGPTTPPRRSPACRPSCATARPPVPCSPSRCTARSPASTASPTAPRPARCSCTPRRWRASCGRCARRGTRRCAATPSSTGWPASTGPRPPRRCRTRSPGCRTGAPSTCGSPRPSPTRPRSRAPWRSSISTASRRSTTSARTPRATRCCG